MNRIPLRSHRRRIPRAFSIIEVLFAIGILALGGIGIIALFGSGMSLLSTSLNTSNAAIEMQTLLTRIQTTDAGTTPPSLLYINRIAAGANWIQDGTNSNVPVQTENGSDYYWSCHVSSNVLNPNNLAVDATPVVALPHGLYQISIFVYRSYSPGKDPLAVFTTMITAGL